MQKVICQIVVSQFVSLILFILLCLVLLLLLFIMKFVVMLNLYDPLNNTGFIPERSKNGFVSPHLACQRASHHPRVF